ncbi:MAG TPA: nitroreductase family protein [Burkholderiales bacterium]|nr:nitroreductase family protein [Burkholderiales bacterium]
MLAEYDALHTIYSRRAVRAYKPEQPSEAVIRELLDAAVQAPTAMHLEPWAFVVIQDKARLKRYSDRAKALLLEPSVAVGWGSAAGRSRHEHLAMLSDPAFNIFYDAGTLLVVCRRTGGAFADADCWLAAENLMLAATAKGLATCCIGFAVGVLNHAEVKRELGIPQEGAAVAPLIVGYARERAAPVLRKAPQILKWVKSS